MIYSKALLDFTARLSRIPLDTFVETPSPLYSSQLENMALLALREDVHQLSNRLDSRQQLREDFARFNFYAVWVKGLSQPDEKENLFGIAPEKDPVKKTLDSIAERLPIKKPVRRGEYSFPGIDMEIQYSRGSITLVLKEPRGKIVERRRTQLEDLSGIKKEEFDEKYGSVRRINRTGSPEGEDARKIRAFMDRMEGKREKTYTALFLQLTYNDKKDFVYSLITDEGEILDEGKAQKVNELFNVRKLLEAYPVTQTINGERTASERNRSAEFFKDANIVNYLGDGAKQERRNIKRARGEVETLEEKAMLEEKTESSKEKKTEPTKKIITSMKELPEAMGMTAPSKLSPAAQATLAKINELRDKGISPSSNIIEKMKARIAPKIGSEF